MTSVIITEDHYRSVALSKMQDLLNFCWVMTNFRQTDDFYHVQGLADKLIYIHLSGTCMIYQQPL